MDKGFKGIIERTRWHLQPEDRVLDFACATGLYSFEFADDVREIQAFDTSPGMIERARLRAVEAGSEGIEFFETTIFDDRFQEGTFDKILVYNILLYFDDMQKVLNRLSLLLKPGGLIITSTACLKERRTLIGSFSGVIIALLTRLGILPFLKFLSIPQLKDSITQGGFNIVEANILMDKPATEYFIVARKC